MKRFLPPSIIGLACVVLCLAMAGAWGFRRKPTPSPMTAQSAAASNPAAALPPISSGSTLTDKTIAKWAAQARRTPANAPTWNNLGGALMQKARETADAAYYGHAERAYQHALTLDPKSLGALTGMAWVNGGRHEFEKSIDWAQKALALYPKSNDAYGLIGDAKVEMGDYAAAFAAYQRMLDIQPDISSYSRGAYLLWLTGHNRKSIWLMDMALRTGAPYAENTAWCETQLALILYSTGAMLPAEQTIQDALKRSPNNYRALALQGRIRAARKDYKGAITAYQQSIAVVPQVDSLAALGDLYALTGNSAEAEKQFAMVDTIDKLNRANGIRGGWQRALFLADHDRDLPEALKDAQDEYATRRNVYAADTLAWCLYKNGRTREAAGAIKTALKHNTPEALFSFHAGMIYAKLGDRRTASLSLGRALRMNGCFHPLYAQVAVDTLKHLGARANSPRIAVSPEQSH